MSEKILDEMKRKYEQMEIPEELDAKTKEGIKKGRKKAYRGRVILFRSGCAVAAAMAALIIMVNTNSDIAYAMERVPVLGAIVKVVDFQTYEDVQEDLHMEANVKVPQVTVTDEEGKEMTEAADTLNKTVEEYTNEIIAMYESDVAATDGGEGHEAVTTDYEVVTDNDRLFALRINTVIAMGGSDSFTKIYNMDKKTGELVKIGDLFEEGSDYVTVISDNIKEQMKAEMAQDEMVTYFYESEMPEWDFTEIKEDVNFYISEEGKLTLVFDKYEVAPGYMGVVEFTIPTEILESIVKDGYLS